MKGFQIETECVLVGRPFFQPVRLASLLPRLPRALPLRSFFLKPPLSWEWRGCAFLLSICIHHDMQIKYKLTLLTSAWRAFFFSFFIIHLNIKTFPLWSINLRCFVCCRSATTRGAKEELKMQPGEKLTIENYARTRWDEMLRAWVCSLGHPQPSGDG